VTQILSGPRRFRAILLVLVALASSSNPAFAQTLTSGSLSGVVVDQQDRVMPGVLVLAVHEPTGERLETTTDRAGRLRFLNVRVGGPYTVTAILSGFADHVDSNVFVALGEDRTLRVQMVLAALDTTVEVTPQTTLNPTRAGTAANVSPETVATLPTIQRSLTDIARTSPYFNALSSNGADPAPSVAGRNKFFNTIQVDGAPFNDLFGASQTGPGGQAGAQPISLDTINEVQLVVAPYDVRQGGFSGGGINAVTKSGSNQLHGTGYGFGQTSGLVGAIPAVIGSPTTRIGAFSSHQVGGSLGGPIVRNRAFFFANVESARQSTPSGFSASGDSGQSWGHQTEVSDVLNIMKTQYGYQPGNLNQVVKATDNDKFFIRSDVNLRAGRLTTRVNYLNGRTDLGAPSAQFYIMPENYGHISESVWSSVAQLDSATRVAFNELRVGWQRDRILRSPHPGSAPFPAVRVDFPDGSNLRLGSDATSQANSTNQDVIELTDDVSCLRGAHTFTVGTHDEFSRFATLFIQNFYGSYEFSSIDNLQAGVAQSFARTFSNTPDPRQAYSLAVRQWGVYAGDLWRATSRVTLTYGLRIDAPRFPNSPRSNPLALSEFGYATDVVPSPLMWSPRAGINWSLGENRAVRSQIRGGAGLFAGRPPYVWVSNEYANTGLDFTALSLPFAAANRVPFIADPFAQPANVGGAGRQTINLIDPRFRFPQVLRGNVAYDRDLGVLGLTGSAELLVSKTIDDAAYRNLNYVATGMAPDGRLTYSKRDPALNDVVLLSNTSKGHHWSTGLTVARPFAHGFLLSASYLRDRTTSVSDTPVGGTALSIWGSLPIGYDVNNPPPATSNYEVGDRVTVTAVVPTPLFGGARGALSLYFNGQSGQPYVLAFNGDANGDGRNINDIVFVPASSDQVIVTGGTWAQLDAYLGADPSTRYHRGGIPPRNAGKSPWTNALDLKYAVTVPTSGRAHAELTLDVANVLNLLNQRWGWVFYPAFNGPNTIGYGGIDRATGKPIYSLSTITSSAFAGTFTRDDLRSRWRAQWGLRLRF
jgi:hypothetical protein